MDMWYIITKLWLIIAGKLHIKEDSKHVYQQKSRAENHSDAEHKE